MTDVKELVKALREEADWCKAIEWEIPICTEDHLREAADLIEKLVTDIDVVRKERDAAVACIEALKDDFVDYVCSGTSNTNPYCANKTDDCTDKRGWCVYVKNCRGFKPKAYEEWRGIDE